MPTIMLRLRGRATAAFLLATSVATTACGGHTETTTGDAGADASGNSSSQTSRSSSASRATSTASRPTSGSMPSVASTSTSVTTSTSTPACLTTNPIPDDRCGPGLAAGDTCHNAAMSGGEGTCRSGIYRGGDDETCTQTCHTCGNYCYAASYLECLAPGCVTSAGNDGCSPVMECGTATQGSSSTTPTGSSTTGSGSTASSGSASSH